mmetsp:Transcript_40495/g.65680  ORF Transcript_40495/g.65680 Transcript_40495/m.65680 type:complete len:358 (-) Transcript_40495:454-1527(-)|eukprot:CAMPEP_0184352810 /NCGR_PEP_ID=MMETSP1089-20130417/71137_1 /TAXON_ID=38269 ORGANISM="Gloeochaete wittrockiana, Strain SAG46.84" /NCGR_SAMPLE_ID=MMETSP1089 /ASSEMBLY_ACC=CAM_ASM_000445 /LENGTH=357 /DNA_ID=CAMNT_0026687729 /DNA_START=27 /DNA_END=1100 /DNA_ORIENTATION=+
MIPASTSLRAIPVSRLIEPIRVISIEKKTARLASHVVRSSCNTFASHVLPGTIAVAWAHIMFLSPILSLLIWSIYGFYAFLAALLFFVLYPPIVDSFVGAADFYNQTWRELQVWKTFREYFPCTLKRSAELPPEEQYLLCVHPHGLFFVGAQLSIACEACDWSKLFPGVKVRPLVASVAFRVPFLREHYQLAGALDLRIAKTRTIHNLSKKGYSFAIIPGGLGEAFHNHSGRDTVYLLKRKGFIRLAIQLGHHLVPVYSFGETDLYDHSMPWLALRERLSRHLRVPIGWYRGKYGTIVPRPRPLTVVVGRPIKVEKQEQPSDEYIARVQAEYVAELRRLFAENRDAAGYGDRELEIL